FQLSQRFIALLQWGRVVEDAEMVGAKGSKSTISMLQWGRVVEDAEIGCGHACNRCGPGASMGPRRGRRGDYDRLTLIELSENMLEWGRAVEDGEITGDKVLPVFEVPASMGPRRGRRGDAAAAAAAAAGSIRFNGA